MSVKETAIQSLVRFKVRWNHKIRSKVIRATGSWDQWLTNVFVWKLPLSSSLKTSTATIWNNMMAIICFITCVAISDGNLLVKSINFQHVLIARLFRQLLHLFSCFQKGLAKSKTHCAKTSGTIWTAEEVNFYKQYSLTSDIFKEMLSQMRRN